MELLIKITSFLTTLSFFFFSLIIFESQSSSSFNLQDLNRKAKKEIIVILMSQEIILHKAPPPPTAEHHRRPPPRGFFQIWFCFVWSSLIQFWWVSILIPSFSISSLIFFWDSKLNLDLICSHLEFVNLLTQLRWISFSLTPHLLLFAHCCLRIDLGLLFLTDLYIVTDFLLVRGVAYDWLIDCDVIVGLCIAVCWLVWLISWLLYSLGSTVGFLGLICDC